MNRNCTFYSRQATVKNSKKFFPLSKHVFSTIFVKSVTYTVKWFHGNFFQEKVKFPFFHTVVTRTYLLLQIVRTVYYRKRQLWPIKVYQWVNRSINSQPSDYWQLFVVLQMYSNKIQFCNKKEEQKITWNWFHEKN